MTHTAEIAAAAASILVAVAIILTAMRSGLLRRVRFGAFQIEASAQERAQAKALVAAVATPGAEPVAFETEQVSQYYAQVLAQSNVSFWFSLLFALLGFVVILIAGFTYSRGPQTALAQGFAGTIMDAVAALFFVQSRSAQSSMSEFFDKLRRDRQQVESRRLCESIASPQARDALRVQLALHYAEVEKRDEIASVIIHACLSGSASRGDEDRASSEASHPTDSARQVRE